MNSDGTIDFNKLENELSAAVEEDARYQRENAAKFRAVEQKVGSYEEFKDIVAASHLKPLDKKDSRGLHNRQQPWNPYAEKQGGKASLTIGSTVTIHDDVKVPKNSHEFLKHWRKCGRNTTEKYTYLLTVGGSKLSYLFKAEVAMGLLGEIIEILYSNWNTVDFHAIYEILHGLSTVKRFSLSVQFLNKKENEVLVKLFNNLEDNLKDMKDKIHMETVPDENSLIALKEIYGIRSKDK